MDAQTFGQWLGVTMIAVFFGYLGYQLIVRPFLWIRGALRRHRRAAAFGEVVGELAKPELQTRNLTLGGVSIREAPPFELMTSSPPCEQLSPLSRRGSHLIVQPARRGGKTEAARRLKSFHDLAHERPYSTPVEAMLLGFSMGRNGEIAIGARLDFERSVIDGDRPSSIEPRGIFGG